MKVYVLNFNATFNEPFLRIIFIMLPSVAEIIGFIGAILIAEDMLSAFLLIKEEHSLTV